MVVLNHMINVTVAPRSTIVLHIASQDNGTAGGEQTVAHVVQEEAKLARRDDPQLGWTGTDLKSGSKSRR